MIGPAEQKATEQIIESAAAQEGQTGQASGDAGKTNDLSEPGTTRWAFCHSSLGKAGCIEEANQASYVSKGLKPIWRHLLPGLVQVLLNI